MEAVQGDDMSLSTAIDATEHLTLRELGSHVHVGPLPLGSVTLLTLPIKELLGTCFFVLVLVMVFSCLYV